MHGTPQEAIRPVAQQVADVDQDRGRRVILGAGWADGHGGPDIGARRDVDLQAGLALEPEEEGDAAVVGVGARAHIVFCGGVFRGSSTGAEVGQGRVVQEAEDVARGTVLAEVPVVEEGGWLDGETYAEEVVDFEGEVVAVVISTVVCSVSVCIVIVGSKGATDRNR